MVACQRQIISAALIKMNCCINFRRADGKRARESSTGCWHANCCRPLARRLLAVWPAARVTSSPAASRAASGVASESTGSTRTGRGVKIDIALAGVPAGSNKWSWRARASARTDEMMLHRDGLANEPTTHAGGAQIGHCTLPQSTRWRPKNQLASSAQRNVSHAAASSSRPTSDGAV